MSRTSAALDHLRAFVILIVLGFHSALAYLASLPGAPFPFDASPFAWRAFPIVDGQRWLGFDIFCAWQDVYLMSLMFFLSALFTWSSLARKGVAKFLADRLQRLGVPFVFGVAVVMPLALYPVYRVSAADPGLVAYGRHFLALPFWPNGPMWFLWQLLVLTLIAAALRRFAPSWVEGLGRRFAFGRTHPGRYFALLAAASALAYVPLALIFTPWSWAEHGPFGLQFSRPLHYAVYYVAGLGLGAYGLERGLLAPRGALARRWPLWLATAVASLLLWMGLTAWAMRFATGAAPLALDVLVDASFALACASSCCFALAGCLRLAAVRSRLLDSLAENAFGMYLVHYAFVVWLQYAVLNAALPAVVKAAAVFGGTLVLAWASAAALRLTPFGSWLVGAGRQALPRPPALAPVDRAHFVLARPAAVERRPSPTPTIARW